MNKKQYKQPTAEAVKVAYRARLLAGSTESRGFSGEIDGYSSNSGSGFEEVDD